MNAVIVPAALAERLGEAAGGDLARLLDSARIEWTNDVTNTVIERAERHIAEQMSASRVELTREFAALRQELAAGFSAALRQEIAAGRVEQVKWTFVFWVRQVAAVATLLGFMLRGRI